MTDETASSAKENGTHQSQPLQHLSVSPHKETDLKNQPNSPLQRKKALRRHIDRDSFGASQWWMATKIDNI